MQAAHAAFWYICWIPVAFQITDQRPHDTPGENGAKKERQINEVGTNHPCPNICEAEIKEESDTPKNQKKKNQNQVKMLLVKKRFNITMSKVDNFTCVSKLLVQK